MNNSPFLSGAEAQLAAGARLAGLKEALQQFEAVQEQKLCPGSRQTNDTAGNKRLKLAYFCLLNQFELRC